MRLVASLVVRNELGRYLEPCVESLLGFCDAVAILDEGSDDGTREWIAESRSKEIIGLAWNEGIFFEHEGRTRQRLLDWTLEQYPTHVLAIDADEFVADGNLLRRMVEDQPEVPAFSLCMTEVWKADRSLHIRCDGGWCPHRAPVVWKVPASGEIRIPDEPAASGRIPTFVPRLGRAIVPTDIEILHFGWTRKADRVARHARYANAGSFGHNPNHIASILYPDSRVILETRRWPDGLKPDVIGEIMVRSNPVLA